jgi:hypothetical protein
MFPRRDRFARVPLSRGRLDVAPQKPLRADEPVTQIDELGLRRGTTHNPTDAVGIETREPVPREHALATDDQVLAKGLDGIEEGVGLGGQIAFEDGLAFGGEDVHEHGSGVQIHAGVELVWLIVVRHVGLLAGDGSS